MKREQKPATDQVTLVREVIASGSVTRLDRCACGDLYLTVGPITMALHPEALADLSATLVRAMSSMGCETGDADSTRPSGDATQPDVTNGSTPTPLAKSADGDLN
jgi:hypothetical protein